MLYTKIYPRITKRRKKKIKKNTKMVLKFLGGNKTDFRSSWFTYYHVRWNSSTALFPVKNVKRKKTKTLEEKNK